MSRAPSRSRSSFDSSDRRGRGRSSSFAPAGARSGSGTIRILALALLLAIPAARAAAVTAGAETPENTVGTPAALFAAVEEAWLKADGERFASLVDTTAVRIALKPGESPTAAVTRTAAAFLFQDQIRLVATREFRVVRFQPSKRGVTASAVWRGDWGGRRGERDVEVALTAARRGARWLLIEVRAKD